jgi:hypothetical protein
MNEARRPVRELFESSVDESEPLFGGRVVAVDDGTGRRELG